MNYMNFLSNVMESGTELLNDSIKLVKLNTNSIQSNSSMSSMSSQCHQSLNIPQTQSHNSLNSNINLVDLGKKLLDASRNGETEEVRSLLQSGAPFTTDWLGTSPLHFAAQLGHSDTAEVLLRAGISRDARTKVDRTPLHIAAQEGHLAIVSLLIMHGSDVDAKDMLKMTPLHWAVERGHTDVVDCLLSNGSDINIQSKFEKTPIDIAYDNGRLEMVPTLQKYVGITRTKPEPKPTSAPAVKMRPIVLPNKSNRTPKASKSFQQQNKQMFIPGPNFANWKKGINFDLSNVRKILTGSGDGMSCNSDDVNATQSNPVLATLAALAAANSSSSSSVAEALQWLETHGISMNNTSTDAAIFQNAFESGQTMSLTEAGKLALNFVKDQQMQSCSSVTNNSNNSNNNNNTSNKNSKVITIVADSAQLPQIISSTQATPIVLVSGSSLPDSADAQTHSSPHSRFINRKNTNHLKIAKTIATTTNTRNINSQKQTNIKHVLISSSNESIHQEFDRERDRFETELKLMKHKVEEYKNQLIEKDKEIERYKKELNELRANQN